jgi:2-hydroxy-3-oxopropionate reductase
MLDAPMIGKVADARGASLSLHVGGAAADFEACAPLLQQFAREVVHVGPTGAGIASLAQG